MAPLRVSTTKSEWLPDDPTAFVPTRLWKLPFITTWDDSRNQNRPTDSAEEAFVHRPSLSLHRKGQSAADKFQERGRMEPSIRPPCRGSTLECSDMAKNPDCETVGPRPKVLALRTAHAIRSCTGSSCRTRPRTSKSGP